MAKAVIILVSNYLDYLNTPTLTLKGVLLQVIYSIFKNFGVNF